MPHADNVHGLPRSDNHAALCLGEAVTVCCGAFATFDENGDLCCKVCWRDVGLEV